MTSWSSPEVLRYRKYSLKSDVWSYGVVVWEIFSKGAIPYSDKSNKEAFDAILDGQILTRPQECSEELFSWILRCWEQEITNRIKISDMCKMFRENYGNALELSGSRKDMGHYVTSETLKELSEEHNEAKSEQITK